MRFYLWRPGSRHFFIDQSLLRPHYISSRAPPTRITDELLRARAHFIPIIQLACETAFQSESRIAPTNAPRLDSARQPNLRFVFPLSLNVRFSPTNFDLTHSQIDLPTVGRRVDWILFEWLIFRIEPQVAHILLFAVHGEKPISLRQGFSFSTILTRRVWNCSNPSIFRRCSNEQWKIVHLQSKPYWELAKINVRFISSIP